MTLRRFDGIHSLNIITYTCRAVIDPPKYRIYIIYAIIYTLFCLVDGQTGSGKTFTMSGPADNRGVNTRSLDELFLRSAGRAADYRDTISVNVLEVYNEDIRDLLVEGGGGKLEVKQGNDTTCGLTVVCCLWRENQHIDSSLCMITMHFKLIFKCNLIRTVFCLYITSCIFNNALRDGCVCLRVCYQERMATTCLG
jgi:hypothetical protein